MSAPFLRLCLLVLMLLPGVGAWAADPAGKVLFATGRAEVVDSAGDARPMERGAPVRAGDTLVTFDGRAQVRMSDGSSFSLEPFTRLRIDEYLDGESLAARAGRAFYSLLKGGFRTITGRIGSEREEEYAVATAVADIGIRGTTYRALLCQGDCARRAGGQGRDDGLHVGVSAGTVFLRNDAGVVDVTAGQSAFVAARDTLPEVQGAGTPPRSGEGAEQAIPEIKPDEQYRPEPGPHQQESHPHPEPYPGHHHPEPGY